MYATLILVALLQSPAPSRNSSPPPRLLRGEVLDEKGAAAAGAEVILLTPDAESSSWIGGPDPALRAVAIESGAEGKFRCEVKGPGPFGLFARSRDGGIVSALAWPLCAGDLVVLRLAARSGHERGQGVHYRVGLPQLEDAVTVVLAGAGEHAAVPPELLEGAPTVLDRVAAPARTLRGKLLGFPPAGADSLRLSLLVDHESSAERVSHQLDVVPDAKGRFSAGSPPGRVFAVLFGPKSWSRPVLFAGVLDRDRDLGDLAAPQGRELEGVVLEEAGPAPGCTVLASPVLTARLPAGDVHPARFGVADRAGRFRLAGLAPGNWRLAALDRGGRRVFGTVTMPASSPVTLRFAGGAEVSGRVLDPEGNAALGAEVYVYGTEADDVLADSLGIPHRKCITGADGVFRVGGLTSRTVYSIQVLWKKGEKTLAESVDAVRAGVEDLEVQVH
jgi:hypothetical protein